MERSICDTDHRCLLEGMFSLFPFKEAHSGLIRYRGYLIAHVVGIACTDVIIPIALTTYALIGISILERTMQELRDNLDVTLPIFGVIANLDDHTNLSADVLERCSQGLSPYQNRLFDPRLSLLPPHLFHSSVFLSTALGAVREHFGDRVFQTVIPRNIKVEEAHNQIACIYDYAPQSTGARAYTRLVEEVLRRAQAS